MPGVPPISRVHETVLYASDLDAAVGFYAGVLGLCPLPRQGDRGVVFRINPEAVLIVFDPGKTTEPNPVVPSHGAVGPGHVALAVAEVEPWREHFRRLGVPVEREVDWPLGGRSLYVRDPARNSVEIVMGRVWPDRAPGSATPRSSPTVRR